MDTTRSVMRTLLAEREVSAPQGYPDRTSYPDMPNYPIKYVDTDEDWIVRYHDGEGIIEVNTSWAEKLWNMDAERWGVSAWDAGITHESAHGWWEDAVGSDENDRWREKIDQLNAIEPSDPEIGKLYDVGSIKIRTPRDETHHERAIETLAAFYLAPQELNDEEKQWAQSVFDMLDGVIT